MITKLLLLSLCTLQSIGLSLHFKQKLKDSHYLQAEKMFFEGSQDISLIKENLLNSSSPEAKALLGELYLIGYNLERNLSLALSYFQEAFKSGSSEAGFYIYLLLLQSHYYNLTELNLPTPTQDLLQYFYRVSISRGSLYSRSLSIFFYYRCNSRFSVNFLRNSEKSLGIFCNHTKKQIAEYSLVLAEESIRYIIDQGRYFIVPEPLYKEVIYEGNSENLIRLALKKNESVDNKLLFYLLGDYYLYGDQSFGIERNITKAIEYLEKAALAGVKESYDDLSLIYLLGFERKINYTTALDYIIKGIVSGSLRSFSGLSYMFINSLKFEKNIEKAAEYLEYSANEGDYESLNNLGIIYIAYAYYLNNEKYSQKYLFELGSAYISLSAIGGYLPAVYNLAVIYMDKMIENPYYCEDTIDILWEVIRVGPLSLYSRLGYTMGKMNDFDGAFWTYSLSSYLGYYDSLLSLNYLVSNNLISYKCLISNDICLAQSNFALAQLGISTGYLELGKIALKNHEFFNNSSDDAVDLFSLADNLGESLFNLAYIWEKGVIVEKNHTKARLMYENIMKKSLLKELDEESYYPALVAWVYYNFLEWIETFSCKFLSFFKS